MLARAPTTEWGNTSRGLRLGIQLDNTSYSAKQPIQLKVFIANRSRRDISSVEMHMLRDYSFSLLRDSEPVAMTAAGERTRNAAENLPAAYKRVIVIPPGSTIESGWPVNLTEWFELSRPGSYSVRVSRVANQPEETLLRSGLIGFTIR